MSEIVVHPEINLRIKCKCGGIGIPATDGEIYFYLCPMCGKTLCHAHSCQDCDLLGIPHEAEFNDLHDEDGSKFLNAIGLVDGKIDPAGFSWVALHGCKTFKKKQKE
jgi:hypothetical protein